MCCQKERCSTSVLSQVWNLILGREWNYYDHIFVATCWEAMRKKSGRERKYLFYVACVVAQNRSRVLYNSGWADIGGGRKRRVPLKSNEVFQKPVYHPETVFGPRKTC